MLPLAPQESPLKGLESDSASLRVAPDALGKKTLGFSEITVFGDV